MEKTQEEMIAEMLAEGLLSEADAERYRTDNAVSVTEMEDVRQMILLCRKRAKSNSKSYSLEEADKIIREKYFGNNQSDETATDSVSNSEISTDDAEYQKQILMLIQQSMKDVEEGKCMDIDEFFNSLD